MPPRHFTDTLTAAINAMRESSDTRWHAVADMLAGGPLSYARLADGRDNPTAYARNYPDLLRAMVVAQAFLGD